MAAVSRSKSLDLGVAVNSVSSVAAELADALARGRIRQGASDETSELDPTICWQAIHSRDPRFDGRFFAGVRTPRIIVDRSVLCHSGSPRMCDGFRRQRRRGCWFPPLQTMPTPHLAGDARMVGHFVGSFACAEAHLQWRTRLRRCRGARWTRGSRCAPSASVVCPAPGSVTRASCANPPDPLRQEPDRADRSSGHQDRVLLRFQKHSTI